MLPMKMIGGSVPPIPDPSPVDVGDDLASTPQVILPKALVVYMDSDLGPFICSNCSNFRQPNTCQMVEGEIDPQGCCNIFAPGVGSGGAASMEEVPPQEGTM